jgi:hypothetical protein
MLKVLIAIKPPLVCAYTNCCSWRLVPHGEQRNSNIINSIYEQQKTACSNIFTVYYSLLEISLVLHLIYFSMVCFYGHTFHSHMISWSGVWVRERLGQSAAQPGVFGVYWPIFLTRQQKTLRTPASDPYRTRVVRDGCRCTAVSLLISSRI